jgi:hypothetical protein
MPGQIMILQLSSTPCQDYQSEWLFFSSAYKTKSHNCDWKSRKKVKSLNTPQNIMDLWPEFRDEAWKNTTVVRQLQLQVTIIVFLLSLDKVWGTVTIISSSYPCKNNYFDTKMAGFKLNKKKIRISRVCNVSKIFINTLF